MRSSNDRAFTAERSYGEAMRQEAENRRFNLRSHGYEANKGEAPTSLVETGTGELVVVKEAIWLDPTSFEELKRLRIVAHKRAKAAAKRARRLAEGKPVGDPVKPDVIRVTKEREPVLVQRYHSVRKRKVCKPFSIDGFR